MQARLLGPRLSSAPLLPYLPGPRVVKPSFVPVLASLPGAIIHVIGDFVQSIGVAVAGALIWWHQVGGAWVGRLQQLGGEQSGVAQDAYRAASAAQEKDLQVNPADKALPASDRDVHRTTHGGTSPTPSAHSCLPSWCVGGCRCRLVWFCRVAGRQGWLAPGPGLARARCAALCQEASGCPASTPRLSLCRVCACAAEPRPSLMCIACTGRVGCTLLRRQASIHASPVI